MLLFGTSRWDTFASLESDVKKWLKGGRMACMKWDMMPTSRVNCPGESDISQGLLGHNSWDIPFTRLLKGKTHIAPSYVPITDRLAAHYSRPQVKGLFVCSSNHFGLSTVARHADNRIQGSKVKCKARDRNIESSNTISD